MDMLDYRTVSLLLKTHQISNNPGTFQISQVTSSEKISWIIAFTVFQSPPASPQPIPNGRETL